MGRGASGVRGIRLKGNDSVVSLDIVDPALSSIGQLLTVMANGFGKRSNLSNYKTQGRGGSGCCSPTRWSVSEGSRLSQP
jgi:DNA gyrase subunit A